MARQKAVEAKAARRTGKKSPRAPKASAPANPVIGVGASAGGLEACTALLRALPADLGLAFVVVQHLDPDHESMLPQILSRATSMKVLPIRSGMAAEPNHVYVIPPNRNLVFSHGRLRLTRRSPAGRQMPVDEFFCSLAKHYGSRAIGIVLSGGASDGTLGLRAIKEEGGITFAQDPQSAKCPGMPQSAVSAGHVDFVLPPEHIAAELARVARHPYVGAISRLPKAPAPADQATLGEILLLLRSAAGVDFTGYRQTTTMRRVQRRMALCRFEKLGQYLTHLRNHPEELNALHQDILIHVTAFFREPQVFAAIGKHILPALLAGRSERDPLRVWVAGCSSGEEVYSTAILLLECLAGRAAPPLQIFGTDLSEWAIQRARAGFYLESALADTPPDRLRRYFVKAEGGYQIAKKIRDLCVFARHDLTRDPPFSKMDLISCRNVLMYMGPELQKRVVGIFHYALKPGGYLLLGKSETLHAQSNLFTPRDRKNKIFSRVDAARPGLFVRAQAAQALAAAAPVPPAARVPFDLQKVVEGLIRERYTPAAVVVDADFQILQFHGDTSPYLKPAPGAATLQLMRLVREDLAVDIRTLVHRARREEGPARKRGIPLSTGGHNRVVNVEVVPIQGRNAKGADLLVVFTEAKGVPQSTAAATADGKGKAGREAARLRLELKTTREHLKSVIGDLEAANEELRAANEEILSGNEELQSTNEEIEIASEELQSTNEELSTLNEELQNRNTELGQLASDLNNLLLGIEIPILILSPDRRIRRMTPPAQDLLNLIPGDVGRPITDIRLGVNVPQLEALISQVLARGVTVDREVRDATGRWHSLRIRPYRTPENKVDGVLISLLDVDDLKRSLERVREALDYAASIVETVREPLLVLDHELRIRTANAAFYQIFRVTREDTENQLLFDLGSRQWDIPELRRVLGEVLQTGTSFSDFEVDHTFPSIGRKRMLLNARPIAHDREAPHRILLAIEDVTARRELEEATTRESGSTIRALLESASQAILAADREGQIILVNSMAEQIFHYNRAELLGRNIDSLLPERYRDQHSQLREGYASNPVSRPMGPGRHLVGLRKDGVEVPIEISLSAVESKAGLLAVAFVTDISERIRAEDLLRNSEAALRLSEGQLRRLTAGLLTAQEEERRRLSRELHDDLNQKLAMLVVEIETLEKELPGEGDMLRDQLGSVRSRAAGLSDDVRRTAYQLHPSIIEHLGLVSALRSLCADFNSSDRLDVRFTHRRVPKFISPDVALCLYRITQESLLNVVKHSGGRAARVTLTGRSDGLQLVVEDEGTGFDPETVTKGLGIISMEERVRLVGGTVTIRSRPGDGARVSVSVPLANPAGGEEKT